MKTNAKKMLQVEQLINNKMMMVDAENYHVAMLAELWNTYYDEGKLHLCRNILNYCNVNNSFNKKPVKSDATLLVSIKDKDNNVSPYAYFRNGRIDVIPNNELMRDPVKRIYWPFAKKAMKVIFIVSVVVGLGVWIYFQF